MKIRINNKKRLYRQYIRTRDIGKFPTRMFNFKRTKWKFFQKILGTTAKYKFTKFEKHKNKYFIKKRYNSIRKLKLPKLTDSFIKTPRAAKWSSRRKAFLMRWMRDKGTRYDYGNLVSRNKPLKFDEQDEILTKRFFAMHFRLGYLLIHNKYFFTFTELYKSLQNKLITVKDGSLNMVAEMPKGAVIEVKNNKFFMDLARKPFLYNFRYRFLYDRVFHNEFYSNFIKWQTFFRITYLIKKFFGNNNNIKFRKKKLPNKKFFKKKVLKRKILKKKILKQKKRSPYKKIKVRRKRRTWKNSYKALLSKYILKVLKRSKKKNQRKLIRRLKLKNRITFRTRSRRRQLPYSIIRRFMKKKLPKRPQNKKLIKSKKVKFFRKKLFTKKKPKKIPKSLLDTRKITSLIKKVKKRKLRKKLFFQKFYHLKRKNKIIKRRVFLPFVEHERYTQTLTILKDPKSLSRNDCILINARKNTLIRSSFLRNRQ